jgi:hypothetical protein
MGTGGHPLLSDTYKLGKQVENISDHNKYSREKEYCFIFPFPGKGILEFDVFSLLPRCPEYLQERLIKCRNYRVFGNWILCEMVYST